MFVNFLGNTYVGNCADARREWRRGFWQDDRRIAAAALVHHPLLLRVFEALDEACKHFLEFVKSCDNALTLFTHTLVLEHRGRATLLIHTQLTHRNGMLEQLIVAQCHQGVLFHGTNVIGRVDVARFLVILHRGKVLPSCKVKKREKNKTKTGNKQLQKTAVSTLPYSVKQLIKLLVQKNPPTQHQTHTTNLV